MHKITPTEELRAAVLRIRLRFEDMVPMPEKKWWELPFDFKDLPAEIREVVHLALETKGKEIVERAKSEGITATLTGVSVHLMEDSIHTGDDHIYVGIVIKKPVRQDDTREVAQGGEIPVSEMITPNSPTPTQQSGATTAMDLPAEIEEQNQDQIKCVVKSAKSDVEIPLVLEAADIIVVDRLESLHPESGGIMTIGLRWKATVNKDRENGEGPFAPS